MFSNKTIQIVPGLLNQENIKFLLFKINDINQLEAENNTYYKDAKINTEFIVMIAAEASMYESFIIAGAELSKSGVEYISGLGMFVGTGGLSAPASAVVATQATLDLTAAGTCAVAGVAFGGIAGNAKFAYDRDISGGAGNRPQNPVKANDNYLKKQGIDAHQFKKDYLGEKAPISQYDIYVDKADNRLWILKKGGQGSGIRTNEFLN